MALLHHRCLRACARRVLSCALAGLPLLAGQTALGQTPELLGSGDGLSVEAWSEKRFDGSTRYATRIIDGEKVLCSDSRGSASALYLQREIDLKATPWLQWRWRILHPLAVTDETVKAGDDFAARVYVLHSSGFWRLGLRALNYVWSRSAPPGASWPNPFAGERAMMLALRRGAGSGWQWEQRHVQTDFRRYLGRDIQHLDGIALMTDSDNSGGRAAACFADIRFVARPDPALSSSRHWRMAE